MDRTLHLRKGLRTTAIVGLSFCLTMGVASVCGIFMEPPQNEKIRPIYMAWFFVLVWGGMSCVSIWLLLAYWRESLTVTDERVIQRGVTRTKVVSAEEIQVLRWRAVGRQLWLHTPTTKMTIHLDNFEPQDRLWLVRYLQRTIPENLQDGWSKFCCEVAVPLRKHETGHLDPSDLLLTRKRWAWYFIPTTSLFVVVGVVLSWKFQLHRSLIAPIAPLLLWALMHFSTPREGMPTSRISSEPGRGRYFLFLLLWPLIGMVATLILTASKPPVPQTIAWIVGGGIIWFAVVFYQATRFDRTRKQREEERGVGALKAWADGERCL